MADQVDNHNISVWPQYYTELTPIFSERTYSAISAGQHCTYAIASDGTVWTLGQTTHNLREFYKMAKANNARCTGVYGDSKSRTAFIVLDNSDHGEEQFVKDKSFTELGPAYVSSPSAPVSGSGTHIFEQGDIGYEQDTGLSDTVKQASAAAHGEIKRKAQVRHIRPKKKVRSQRAENPKFISGVYEIGDYNKNLIFRLQDYYVFKLACHDDAFVAAVKTNTQAQKLVWRFPEKLGGRFRELELEPTGPHTFDGVKAICIGATKMYYVDCHGKMFVNKFVNHDAHATRVTFGVFNTVAHANDQTYAIDNNMKLCKINNTNSSQVAGMQDVNCRSLAVGVTFAAVLDVGNVIHVTTDHENWVPLKESDLISRRGYVPQYDKLAAGNDHLVVLDNNGNLYVWGDNQHQQTGYTEIEIPRNATSWKESWGYGAPFIEWQEQQRQKGTEVDLTADATIITTKPERQKPPVVDLTEADGDGPSDTSGSGAADNPIVVGNEFRLRLRLA